MKTLRKEIKSSCTKAYSGLAVRNLKVTTKFFASIRGPQCFNWSLESMKQSSIRNMVYLDNKNGIKLF